MWPLPLPKTFNLPPTTKCSYTYAYHNLSPCINLFYWCHFGFFSNYSQEKVKYCIFYDFWFFPDMLSCVIFHQSWDTFFRSVQAGLGPGLAYTSPPSLSAGATFAAPRSAFAADEKSIVDHLSVQLIIRSFQVFFISIPDLFTLFYISRLVGTTLLTLTRWASTALTWTIRFLLN